MNRVAGATKPHDHTLSFHDYDWEAVTALVRYVVAGLANGERVVVVATAAHLAALDDVLLTVHSSDPVEARATGYYLTLDAARTLDEVMVDGLPDADRFATTVGAVMTGAGADGTGVRVYGEMVAVLWEQGNVAAVIALEQLWNALGAHQDFHLLCSYPASTLSAGELSAVTQICELHSSTRPPANYGTGAAAAQVAGEDLERSEVFLPVPEAVAALAHFVSDVLRAWGEEDLRWDASLIAAEMATNARINGVPFRGFVARSEGVIRIGVERIGAGLPGRRGDKYDSSGSARTAVVQRLAHRWGRVELPDGETAWAELVTGPA